MISLSAIIQRIFPEKNASILSNISTLQLEVTNNCNLHCSICWRALREEKVELKDIPFAKFKKAIDGMLKFFPVKTINTQGLGEPLLCPEILKILDYAKSKGLTVWFVTNGTLIDDNLAKRLVEIGVDKIRISVDSADRQVYSAIKCGSDLDAVICNIGRLNHYKELLQKQAPVISFNSVVLHKNLSGIEELIDLASRNKVEEITLIPLVNFSKGLSIKQEQVDFYNDSFRANFDGLKEKARIKGLELNQGISLESQESRFCNFGFYLDVDGYVRPCCNISRFNFGNINNNNLEVITRKYLKFREWIDKNSISCKQCNGILDKR
jgi:MoaA/NifB/PqqE/SkfB family radical SAM enzyme